MPVAQDGGEHVKTKKFHVHGPIAVLDFLWSKFHNQKQWYVESHNNRKVFCMSMNGRFDRSIVLIERKWTFRIIVLVTSTASSIIDVV